MIDGILQKYSLPIPFVSYAHDPPLPSSKTGTTYLKNKIYG
jgi:hypothetical protein